MRTGIVLSGGGMRGAYEVGVVAGIRDVLARKAHDPPLFRVFAGTSVGAINATFFAANAQRGDHGIDDLLRFWNGLRLEDHAKVRPFGLLRWPRRLRTRLADLTGAERPANSLLDTSALERIVDEAVDWQQLHRNVDHGVVHALAIAALHVVSGNTTIFVELAPGAEFRATRNERRVARPQRIVLDHVLASAAIPLLFPTRRVGSDHYCDGGLRFNTPIAPAIRAGADRLVVVSVLFRDKVRGLSMLPPADRFDLSPTFLIGKLLNALLLDPVLYDLQILERFNELVDVLADTLTREELDRVQRTMVRARGAPYRRIPTLSIMPSANLGDLAGDYVKTSLSFTKLNPLARYLMQRAAKDAPGREADWASYLLFDGGFATRLIDLGRQDAHDKADEIRRFFAD